jgi:hypothetical protein
MLEVKVYPDDLNSNRERTGPGETRFAASHPPRDDSLWVLGRLAKGFLAQPDFEVIGKSYSGFDPITQSTRNEFSLSLGFGSVLCSENNRKPVSRQRKGVAMDCDDVMGG